MNILISIILSTIGVFVTAQILPGVHIESIWTALIVAVVMGIVNSLIFPLLLLLTLPINVITLGLFTFVIIGFLVLLVSSIVPGFQVDGFFWGLVFAIVLYIINTFIRSIFSTPPSSNR